jgi:hypothetical protein
MAKFPVMTVFVLLAAIIAVHLICSTVIAVSPMTDMLLDLLMLAGAAIVIFGMLDMVGELNVVALGILIFVAGHIVEDWFVLVSADAKTGLAFNYLALSVGLFLTLYGLAKFQQHYKFK